MDQDILIKIVNELEETASEIETNMEELIKYAKIDYSTHSFIPFVDLNLKEVHRQTLRDYQQWYSSAIHLVKQYLPDKATEFFKLYSDHGFYGGEGVFDLIRFDHRFVGSDSLKQIWRTFYEKFEIQRSILLTVPAISRIKEISLREIISASFTDREIDEAEYLFGKKYYRCAGALAGVALEQRLRVFCERYEIDYNKKDTIEPLIQKLYKYEKVDVSKLKEVQYLASIRDGCDHPSDIDPNKIKELIEKVKRITI